MQSHVQSGAQRLLVERSGSGSPIVLAHGLTATHRYVVHGSRLLERSGFDVLSYDARGHGASDPAPRADAYGYGDLLGDLEAVVNAAGIERAVFAGASMGAATTLAFALAHPERVSALIQITPAHLGVPLTDRLALARWDSLADALETSRVEGFMQVYGDPPIDDRFKGLVKQAIRQRLERHKHPAAVAKAIRVVTRSVAFDGPGALARLPTPTLIVGSRDQLDPEHPLDVARRYEELIPDSELLVEEAGESPIAWRGAKLSKAIMGFLKRRDLP